MPRFCALLSGGKDSNYALYRALREGYEPACILVVRSERPDSWMFHTPHVDLALLQAEAMGLREKVVSARVSGVKEREVEELYYALRRAHEEIGFDVIVVGALASRYQYERIKRIADSLGVSVFAPAWQADPEEYMRRIVSEGIRFIIIKISVMGLPPRLLGVPIVGERLEEVLSLARKYGFHPAFEGGEAETLVYDAPHYRARLCLEAERRTIAMYEHALSIRRAWLSRDKNEKCIVVNGEITG
ncbi:MAG: diphthine--ammonia ligase [Desulfurococcales archaeon]|nr:diphthine--ammonia ligase [Desulfurococcales archaeon]